MRIRLIQPPLVQPLYRQLTLPVVGAEFSAQGFDVEVCDENLDPVDMSDVDLVGISCHVYNAPRAIALSRAFRERGIPVILGGTFATVAPQLLAPHADSIVVGELEGQTERIAIDARSGHLAPLYQSESPPPLTTTLRPNFGLLQNDRYLRYNFPIELSRGCRFSCRFCTARSLFPKPRTRSLSDIERDLGQYDFGLVEIVDVNFLNDPSFFRRVEPILSRAHIPGWTGQTTIADLSADATLPERLAKSGCRAVFVGLETLSAPGLRSLDKGWSLRHDFLDIAKRLRDVGVLVQVGLIVGMDTDDLKLLDETARMLERACVQTASITYLHYYPATPPYEELERAGRLTSRDWRDLDGNHQVIRHASLTDAELHESVRTFLKRFYSIQSILRRGLHRGMLRRPGQLVHHWLVNLAMRGYYQALCDPHAQPSAIQANRYDTTPRALEPWEKRGADLGAWIIDRLWPKWQRFLDAPHGPP